MASEEKERLRRERLKAERREEAAAKRRSIVGRLSAAVLALAAVAGIYVLTVVLATGDTDDGSEEPFGQHHDGLEQRRVAANVPTMGEAGGQVHYHPTLAVYADGRRIDVPANIGIDPGRPPQEMVGLHTHDRSGTVHVEAAEGTLGQFFEVWGVPFSSRELGPYKARGSKKVRMWVDGKPSRAFGDLPLEDGQEITIAYGSERDLPAGLK